MVHQGILGAKDAVMVLISRYFPSEVPYFEVIWTAFASMPEARFSRGATTPASSELGFAGGGGLNLVTPRVLAATYAAVFDATKFPGDLPDGYVSQAVENYGEQFDVPASLLPEMEALIASLVRADFKQTGVFPTGDIGHDEVTVLQSGKPQRTGPREVLHDEIEQLRQEKAAMDIFLDDIRNDFLVRNTPKSLPPMQRRLLVALLARVGDYWSHSDLLERLWGDSTVSSSNLHQLLDKLHKTTDRLLVGAVDLPPGLDRCYVKSEVLERLKYAVIVISGVYRL
jgi:hypothetical protein